MRGDGVVLRGMGEKKRMVQRHFGPGRERDILGDGGDMLICTIDVYRNSGMWRMLIATNAIPCSDATKKPPRQVII
jgi:hypothetical protein